MHRQPLLFVAAGCLVTLATAPPAAAAPASFATPFPVHELDVRGVFPATSVNARGAAVVAWQRLLGDGDGYAVYARRFDRARQPLGPELQLNQKTADHQDEPAVAMFPDGGFVAAWEDRGKDGDDWGIVARCFDREGRARGDEFQVNVYTAGRQRYPEVAADAAGNFAVAWQSNEQDGSADGVFVRLYGSSCQPRGGEIQVNTATFGGQRDPDVAMAADGDFIVVFHEYTGDLLARRFGGNGSPQGAVFQVQPDDQSVDHPRVAMGADGAAVVVWESFDQPAATFDVYGQRLGAAGGKVGGAFRVNTTDPASQSFADVAIAGDGNFVVTWQSTQDRSIGGYGMFARGFAADGSPMGDELALHGLEVQGLRGQVAADQDGDIFVAWQENAGNVFASYAVLSLGSCLPADATLCLRDRRMKVEVDWRVVGDPDDETGEASAVDLTSDTGYFWFFSDANVEVVLKVLDGTGINSHFWVFYGALSNVAYAIIVTDMESGRQQVYVNPSGAFASLGDIEALEVPQALPGDGAADASPPSAPTPSVERPELPQGSCAPTATALCLNGDRFRVEVSWEDFEGGTGVGTAVPLTSDTGTFWFFDEANVELILKVLDGRPINDHFWVFYGALSNVAFTITITDTVTGDRKQYVNPLERFASVGDIEAF